MTMLAGRQSNIQDNRQMDIDQHGTAPLSFLNTGDVAVDTNGGGNIIDFAEETKTAKHYPFDNLIVNNKSSSDIIMYINQKRSWQHVVRSGTIVPITDFKGVRSIRYAKLDSAVTVLDNQIQITVERKPLSQDEKVRRNEKLPTVMKIIHSKLGI